MSLSDCPQKLITTEKNIKFYQFLCMRNEKKPYPKLSDKTRLTLFSVQYGLIFTLSSDTMLALLSGFAGYNMTFEPSKLTR